MTKVLVFGTFDVLHAGHLSFLKQARQFGEELKVIVAKDETVKSIKGKKPRQDENKRLQKVQAIDLVNSARLGYINQGLKIVEEEEPDVICLGYDQKNAFEQKLWQNIYNFSKPISIIRLIPWQQKIYKSSLIKQ
ncbi:MAG: adenylyltransferase/cytidyltransferase family protein [bacterium]